MSRRVGILAIIAALVVGGLVLDRSDDVAVGTSDDIAMDATVFPMARTEGSLSSTWFCAGGTADETAFADHVITMFNPTERAMTVVITAFAGRIAPAPVNAGVDALDPDAPDDTADGDATSDDSAGDDTAAEDTDPASTTVGAPVERAVEIGPRSRTRLALSELLTAPIASALVETANGALVVEHEVRSVHGLDAKPCATAASDVWHFAWGTTVREARELLVLFNPFPDDAIVDGRFSTEDGIREPVRFDGLVVPARSSLAVDLGDDVTRRQEVAATITTRSGRIVADRILRIDGEGVRGLTVSTGIPVPQRDWIFPDGFLSEDVGETYVVYNPGATVAEVAIEFSLDRPDENGIPEPVELSIAPGAHAAVDIRADGRVPEGIGHATVVRSENGVPVVAERVVSSSTSTRRGLTVTTGSPVEAEEWRFAAGSATGANDLWLILFNLDSQVLAEVDIVAVAGGQVVPISELQDIVVEASERVAIRIGERIQRDDLALLVVSSEPIVAERGWYRQGAEERGMSNAIGVPVDGTWRLPGDPLALDPDVDLGDLEVVDDPDLDGIPQAPDDVELPEPDETIVIEDPDAEATIPPDPDAPEDPDGDGTSTTTTTEPGGVPDTTPPEDEPSG